MVGFVFGEICLAVGEGLGGEGRGLEGDKRERNIQMRNCDGY